MLQVASRLLGNPSNMDQATLQIEGRAGIGKTWQQAACHESMLLDWAAGLQPF